MNKLSIILLVSGIILAFLFFNHRYIKRIKSERDRFRNNTEVLYKDIEQYAVRDSLITAKMDVLALELGEYKKLHKEDAELVKDLQGKFRHLEKVNTIQAQTIATLKGQFRDTIIYRDTIIQGEPTIIPEQFKKIEINSRWCDFRGELRGDAFTGEFVCRDSIKIVDFVKYKRFLGFLWRTKKIKKEHTEIISLNPNCKIIGANVVRITK